MKKLFVGIGVVVTIVATVAAFATGSQVRPAGAPIDTVTFPDGTTVNSAYVGGWSSSNVVVVQIKQPDGKICYGVTMQSSSGGASVSCLP